MHGWSTGGRLPLDNNDDRQLSLLQEWQEKKQQNHGMKPVIDDTIPRITGVSVVTIKSNILPHQLQVVMYSYTIYICYGLI